MSSRLRQVEVSDIVSRHGGKRLATSSIPFLIQSNFSSLMILVNSIHMHYIGYMLYDIGMTVMFCQVLITVGFLIRNRGFCNYQLQIYGTSYIIVTNNNRMMIWIFYFVHITWIWYSHLRVIRKIMPIFLLLFLFHVSERWVMGHQW